MPAKFQSRHHEAIAEVIRNHRLADTTSFGIGRELYNTIQSNTMAHLASTLADMFEKDNPNFKREKFIRRCGWH